MGRICRTSIVLILLVHAVRLFYYPALEGWRQQNLDCHNRLRKRYKAGPLINDERANFAAMRSLINESVTIPDVYAIFNVTVNQTSMVPGDYICKQWIEAGKGFDYEVSNATNEDMKRFAQMVWRNTKFIGAGILNTDNKQFFDVLKLRFLYYPKGNIEDQYVANVYLKDLPPEEGENRTESELDEAAISR